MTLATTTILATILACGRFAADDGAAQVGDAAQDGAHDARSGLGLDASVDDAATPAQACANVLTLQPATPVDWSPPAPVTLKSARYGAGDGHWYVSTKSPLAQIHAAMVDGGVMTNDDRFVDPIRGATSVEEQAMPLLGGRALVFQSDREDAGFPQLHVGVRSDLTAPFEGPVRLDVGTGFQAQDPYAVGADVYFAKQLGIDKSTRQIHHGKIVSGAPPMLSDVLPLDSLGAPAEDDHPVVTADQLEIFWTSKRGDAGSGVFHATRTSVTAPFGDVQPVSVTSGVTDLTWISDDGCDIYAIASGKLYVMSRR